MRIEGKLTEWNDSKGFGFITPTDGDQRVFVHISAFPKGRRPELNNRVSFTLGEDEQQRPRATRIKFTGPPKIRLSVVISTWNLVITGCAVLLVFAALGLMVWQQIIPAYLPIVYGALSIILFTIYGIDKRAAKNNKRREPENALHLFALAGGWPGAWLAQKVFKHKTIKQPFKFIFWCTVIIHVSAFFWLAFASSAAGLRSLLGFPI